MGISGIGPGSLLLILAIVLLVFGTKRLRNMGKDVGGAVKGFKDAMAEDKDKLPEQSAQEAQQNESKQRGSRQNSENK